jgi:hypothetical protein
MVLDQHMIRALADQGVSWNDLVADTATRVGRVLHKGARKMIGHSLDHIRQLAVLMAVLVVSAGFIGIAVLPGAVALGLAA